MQKTILITAGGTGGHVFPALALSHVLKDTYNLIWVGGASGIEHDVVPKHNINLETINVSALRGKGLIRLAILPFILIRAFFQALIIILKYRPDALVGFGGYATFPISIMGRFLNIPVFIHEQNAIPGLTNKILAKIANAVMVAFPNVLPGKKTILVGNPVRDSITKIVIPESRYNNQDNKLRILVIGGSLGAKIFNEIMPQVCSKLNMQVEVIHQVGRGDVKSVQDEYINLKISAKVINFIDNIAEVYANADLIICRSGASTVSEVCVAGIAAIFVPYPYAVDDHQFYNAKWLAEENGAKIMRQAELTIESLSSLINQLSYNDYLNMAKIARSFAITDSAMRIQDIIRHKIG